MPPPEKRGLTSWPWLAAILAVTVAVHRRSLALGLVGDDFVWWYRGRQAFENGLLHFLFGPVGQYYRPANVWTKALEVGLFGSDPFYFHAFNLGLHLLTGALFFVLLSRFVASPAVRAVAALLWLCSPHSLEPAQSVTIAEDLYLPIAWLALGCLWPGPGEPWRPRRAIAAIALGLLTLFTKETWVVLPALLVAFDRALSDRPWKDAVRRALLPLLVTAVYVAAYLLLLPRSKDGYYSGGFAAWAKLPHAFAAMANLTAFAPADFPFGPAEILSLAVLAALAWLARHRRDGLVLLGLAFFVLALLPYLPVPFMTSRYTMTALLGFLMATLAVARRLLAAAPPRARTPLSIAAAAFAGLWLAGNVGWIRAEMTDAERLSAVHQRLVAEARAFAADLPRDRTLVCVRLEDDNPLLDLARVEAAGLQKIYFQRSRAPYGLVDWEKLFSYVRHGAGGPVFVALAAGAQPEGPYAVIGHVAGGFQRFASESPGAGEAAAALGAKNLRVTSIAPLRPD